jgi:hypothetical protein
LWSPAYRLHNLRENKGKKLSHILLRKSEDRIPAAIGAQEIWNPIIAVPKLKTLDVSAAPVPIGTLTKCLAPKPATMQKQTNMTIQEYRSY